MHEYSVGSSTLQVLIHPTCEQTFISEHEQKIFEPPSTNLVSRSSTRNSIISCITQSQYLSSYCPIKDIYKYVSRGHCVLLISVIQYRTGGWLHPWTMELRMINIACSYILWLLNVEFYSIPFFSCTLSTLLGKVKSMKVLVMCLKLSWI